MASVEDRQVKALLSSYCLAERPERKARLSTVIELAVELERIKKVSIFATAFHEQAIEAVIEGDWEEAMRINADLNTFCDHDAQAEFYRALWEGFRATVLAACDAASKRALGIEENAS
jgi:hypothetical protein